jgi:hypothetical protein
MRLTSRHILGAALILSTVLCLHGVADENLVDRWATAVGGREKVAGIRSMYREATIEVAGYKGTIKTWHTPEGKYRKDELIGPVTSTEIFDGTHATIQQGAAPPHTMAGPDLERARSTAFANSNAMFFAFFPERRQGTLVTEGEDTIVLKREGGIDWRVTIDPQTALPMTMVHKEGDRTITVTFVSYVTVDGITFEQEIRRSTGDPRFHAVIRFTKTVINPTIDPSLFLINPTAHAQRGSPILGRSCGSGAERLEAPLKIARSAP